MRYLLAYFALMIGLSGLSLETRSKCRRRFGVSVPAELEASLEEGEDKLAHARAAIAKGAERPLAAIRFAREAFDVAASTARRVEGPATAPG